MKSQEIILNTKKNWYIVEIIQKCEPVGSSKNNDLRRVSTWGNYHLIKAASPEKAFDKAVKLGEQGTFIFTDEKNREMELVFVGIGELIPIEEDIEDGAELMWTDYGFISDRNAHRMARSRNELIGALKKK